MITAAVLASAASTLVGGASHVAGAAAASAAQDNSASALDPTAYLVNELFRRDHPDVGGNPQAAHAETTPIIARGLSEGNLPAADKAYLAQLVAARTGLSQPDAAKRVESVDTQVKAAWAKTRQAADQARKAAAYLSFFTAFSMLIGAFIAAVMATVAGHRRDEMLALRRPL